MIASAGPPSLPRKLERDVADAARRLGERETPGQLAHRIEELDGVVVVFLQAGSDRQDVHVEDDVGRIEADLVHQQVVGELADLDLVRGGFSLPLRLDAGNQIFLLERDDDDRGPEALHRPGLFEELVDAFLQADRVDDRLPLDALEACLDDLPLQSCRLAIGNLAMSRLGRQQVQEAGHLRLAVEQVRVHVHVEDVRRAPFDLGTGDLHGLVELVLLVMSQGERRFEAGDVAAAADHDDEVRFGPNSERGRCR